MDSRIPGLYELTPDERLDAILERRDLTTDAEEHLRSSTETDIADRLSENVIGTITYPIGIATNFTINGSDVLVPMAIEESSVVAAASHGAKLARETGGFRTSITDPRMIGQIQVTGLDEAADAVEKVRAEADTIRELANDQGVLVSHGGGCTDVTARIIDTPHGEMVVVHLLVDVRDAMGANAVNTMVEAVGPYVEELTGGETVLCILSNLADRRLARARCTVPPSALDREESERSGEEVRDRIVAAWAFAAGDPYRAATHNKGVMNGMDGLALATMNDWRAIEAGGHAYAAFDGYGPLTSYRVTDSGALECSIEVPVQVGTVGGATRVHPTASAAMEILGVESANELAGVFAAVGLAENLASMRALADEGIQTGHMKLHAKNVVAEAGAPSELIDEIANRMIEEDDVRSSRARELLAELRE